MKILLAIMAAILACTATAMAVTPGDLHTRNFGCAGNGTTDDTVNFERAINAECHRDRVLLLTLERT
jgi:hypothetical protein